jgi:hypothetical protein
MFHTGLLHGLLLNFEKGDDMLFLSWHLTDYTVLKPRGWNFSKYAILKLPFIILDLIYSITSVSSLIKRRIWVDLDLDYLAYRNTNIGEECEIYVLKSVELPRLAMALKSHYSYLSKTWSQANL